MRGDTVQLTCEFTGDGNVKGKWLHLGQQWAEVGVGKKRGHSAAKTVNKSSQDDPRVNNIKDSTQAEVFYCQLLVALTMITLCLMR